MAAMVGMALSQNASCYMAASTAAPLRCQDSGVPSAASYSVKQASNGELKSGFVGCVKSFRVQQHGVVVKNVGQMSHLEMRAMAQETSAAPETFEVELEKPFGLRFYKGRDGGTFVDVIQPGSNADQTGKFTVGDKVLATSAVFGTEMWPAAEYGRTMYTIRQRVGSLVMKVEKRYGKREDQANAEQVAKERNAGQIGDAVREIQIQNYLRNQELKQQRQDQLNEGLKLYKLGKYQEALEKFETVLGLKPGYREIAVASYNVSCCYSKLNELEAGLSALEEAMESGFEDYKAIRQDPDLANLRTSPKFTELLNKFDEPFLNEGAMNAIKSVFGIFGKK